MVINQEILGGLKSALERGESLKRAMMTFYNSGYKKEEIEEVARMLLQYNRESHPNFPIQEIPKAVPVQQPEALQKPAPQTAQQLAIFQRPAPQIAQQPEILQRPALQIQRPAPQTAQTWAAKPAPVQAVKYAPIQKISNYEEGITSREKAIIVILIILLVFLIGILGLILLFKQQIINFFSGFLG
jgi:hypothetical protein